MLLELEGIEMIKIGSRCLGSTSPCFIVYEAGPTHNGLDSAKELISLAAESGADAIKFQIFDPDRLVADKKLPFSYEVLVDRSTGMTETITEPLYNILCRRCLSNEEWKEVREHSSSCGLAFFATIGFEEDIRLLEELNCDSIKIASADVNHAPLIRSAAQTGMCIQLDTGNASLGEIEFAVDICREEGNERIIIHNCPSGYPARLDSINLRFLSSLKQVFPHYPIAYSDHTPGWDMDVAAVALGANLVEKTITFDKTTRSVEHIFSLEPNEMKHFVKTIRDVERAMGSSRRVLSKKEKEYRKAMRRSTYIKHSCSAGDILTLELVEFRRPGDGVGPDIFETLLGARIKKDLPAGHKLSLTDLVD